MRCTLLLAAFFSMGTSVMAADIQHYHQTPSPAPAAPVYQSKTPGCDNTFILRDVRKQFAHKERNYWKSNLQIDGFSNVRETAFRPWKHTLIERRFCEADVLLSNTSSARAYYSISYRTGLAGTNFGTEICVEKADHNMAYAPDCKMAKP